MHPATILEQEKRLVSSQVVIAKLDLDTVKAVQQIWQRLAAAGIRTPIDQEVDPHIVVGKSQRLETDQIRHHSAKPLSDMKGSIVEFNKIGFSPSNDVCLVVLADPKLMAAGYRFEQILTYLQTGYMKTADSPINWQPQVDLAYAVADDRRLADVRGIIRDVISLPWRGSITECDILEYAQPIQVYESDSVIFDRETW